jgi:thiamine-monophosphate kinase
VVGPGDDAAAIEPARGALEVLTTDAQIDGVHFDSRFVPPASIGHRALAVNLSDLAAMGARPRAALLSLALPPSLPLASFDGIVDGMVALADEHGVAIIGGNITSTSGPLVVDVTAVGSAHRRKILRRSGARPGDEVWMTGTLGEAAAGLRRLQRALETGDGEAIRDEAGRRLSRYLWPQPRVRAGLLLARNSAASSCIDLSDGLADGVRQITHETAIGITIDAAALPIPADARMWLEQHNCNPLDVALTGGDDFELLFTVRPTSRGRLRTVRRQLGNLPITRIGAVTRDRRLLVKDERGVRELPAGFEHFR